MPENNDVNIEKLFESKLFLNKEVYRGLINSKSKLKYCWKLKYKQSDLFINADKDIIVQLSKNLVEFYELIESFIKKNPVFLKSLVPLRAREEFPQIINKMCSASEIFNVGPMASIAGAFCDYLCEDIEKNFSLTIENGGDLYIYSDREIISGMYLKSNYFKNDLKLKIKKELMPCGLASSSGTLGHSLSMGRSDLVVVLAKTAILADSAATSIGNLIRTKDDIEMAIKYYKNRDEIIGIAVFKDDKIGLFGNIELVN